MTNLQKNTPTLIPQVQSPLSGAIPLATLKPTGRRKIMLEQGQLISFAVLMPAAGNPRT